MLNPMMLTESRGTHVNLPAVMYVVSVGNIQVDCLTLLQVGILTALQPKGYNKNTKL